MKKLTVKLLLISFLLTVMGGCSLSNSDERYIERKLKEKYGVRFKVSYSKEDNDVVIYYGNEKGNNKRKVTGIYNKRDNYVTDTYIDAKVVAEIGVYLTEEMQELIPGIVAVPSLVGTRYKETKRTDLDVSIDQWVEYNYDDFLRYGTDALSIYVTFLIPERSKDNLDFENYKIFILNLIDTKFSNLAGMEIEGAFYYDSEELRDAFLNVGNIGYYETSDLFHISSIRTDRVETKTAQELNRFFMFRYVNGELRRKDVLEFKYEGDRQ